MKRLIKFPLFVQLIWMLCVLGALINIFLMIRDFLNNPILFRLHLGYFILYVGQLVFILLQEKYVAFLTLLQGIIALLTTADFIFAPLIQMIGHLYYWIGSPSIETLKTYQYMFVSVAFTLQMASAAYLWGYFYLTTTRK